MKKALMAVALAATFLGAPARAVDPQSESSDELLVVHQELVQVSNEMAQKLEGQSRVPQGFAKDPQVKVLESGELMFMANRPALLHMGRKFPIVYYDPRTSQFQIQYVDVGVKVDVRCTTDGDTLTCDVNNEAGVLAGIRTPGTGPERYPQTEVLRCSSVDRCHFGESVIVGRVHGAPAHSWLAASSLAAKGKAVPNDNLMMVVTFERVK